jgi:hypothetical protein
MMIRQINLYYTYLQLLDEFPGVGGADEDVALGGLDEPVVHRLVDERQQEVVVPVHVQQAHLHACATHRHSCCWGGLELLLLLSASVGVCVVRCCTPVSSVHALGVQRHAVYSTADASVSTTPTTTGGVRAREWWCVMSLMCAAKRAHRLAVDAQLRPRDHLQELVQRPVPACN